jgi:hypothetical protein
MTGQISRQRLPLDGGHVLRIPWPLMWRIFSVSAIVDWRRKASTCAFDVGHLLASRFSESRV